MATQSSWIGKTLSNRYEIVEMLGQGGMSAVYKANDPNLRRVVAIKLIHEHLSSNAEFARRFEEEAATVAQLRHPNLIQVFDFAHDGDTFYIVFEFVPGETVQERIKRLAKQQRQMDVSEALDVTAKTADGLHYAHNKGLIHRDIKPANIMLNLYGEPILMDFGISKIMGGTQHTATGAVLGTARYMSPEQIKGERIDPRTDIYSLGVTLFEMLGGRPPFEADSAMTLMMMHITDPVPDLRVLRADLSPAVVAVVNKSLEKDPDNRYQTAGEFAAALRAATSAESTADTGATIVESMPAVDPGATIVEPITAEPTGPSTADLEKAAAAAVVADSAATAATTGATTGVPAGVSTGAAVPPPPPPPAQTAAPASGGGNRNILMAVAGVIGVLIILAGLWFAFRPDDTEDPIADNPGEGVVEDAATPTDEPEPTDEPAATEEAEATEEPEATDEPEPEPTEEMLPEMAVGAAEVVGDVEMITAEGAMPISAETDVPVGAQIATGTNSRINFELDDESLVYVAQDSLVSFDELAEDPEDSMAESIVRVEKGDVLLRKTVPGNVLNAVDDSGESFATLFLLEDSPYEGSMAVRTNEDGSHRVSCFLGQCRLAGGSTLAIGQEAWLAPDGSVTGITPIEPDTLSYTYWQEECYNCLPVLATPVPTEPPYTPTPEVTNTPPPPTQAALGVRITNITLNESGTYVVEYTTSGYTEQLPGQHVHFYWNNISQDQAGVGPTQANWFVYGGPRPFQGWGVNNRPANVTAMCAIVANADHTAVMDSGNCFNLPQ